MGLRVLTLHLNRDPCPGHGAEWQALRGQVGARVKPTVKGCHPRREDDLGEGGALIQADGGEVGGECKLG